MGFLRQLVEKVSLKKMQNKRKNKHFVWKMAIVWFDLLLNK